MYMTNHLVAQENDKCLKTCAHWNERHVSKAIDSATSKVVIDEHVAINETAGLPKSLTVCVGARVMLTRNEDIEDKLINGSTGTVKYIQGLRNAKPNGTIYVQFDNPLAGNKLKDNRLRGELKTCVPIRAKPQNFQRRNITVTRKQFPLIVAFSTTIHKAQGSTLDYMSGNMDQTTKSGKRLAPVGPGMLYTLLSRATLRSRIQLLNFDEERHVVVNEKAKIAMETMRNNNLLSYVNPLKEMHHENICLFNIRSWNLHIDHFLSDKVYPSKTSLFCFTETHTLRNIAPVKRIEDHPGLESWTTIHKDTGHGLAISYNTTKVKDVRQFDTVSSIESLPVLMTIEDEAFLLVLIYRPPPESIPVFIQSLEIELSQVRGHIPITNYRTLILGDFNLPQNREDLNDVLPSETFHQRCHYSTHIDGNILDLVFDDKKSEPVKWMPSPYSDHFVILIDLFPAGE